MGDNNGTVRLAHDPEANELMRGLIAVMVGREIKDIGQFVLVAMSNNGGKCDSPNCAGFHRIEVISTAVSSFVAVDILDRGIIAVEASPVITGLTDDQPS